MNYTRVLSEVVTQFVLPPSLMVVRLPCLETAVSLWDIVPRPQTILGLVLGFSRCYNPLTPTKNSEEEDEAPAALYTWSFLAWTLELFGSKFFELQVL
jgi:hypothetical protein